MEWLVNLIPGGSTGLIGGAIALILGIIGTVFFQGKKAGRNEQKAKEADAYEKHLEDIGKAADARNSVRPDDSVPDKYRRD